MKKGWILFLLICLALVGCSEKEKLEGAFDIQGIVNEINAKEDRILVEDKDTGLTWVTLPESGYIQNYRVGQEVVVWVDGGISESYPALAKALHIEVIQDTDNNETLATKAQVTEGDFIYRLVTEKAVYGESEPVKIFAELEYIGDKEKIEIYHAYTPFYFPMIEKTRNYEIDYFMNQPLVSTELLKGQPLREEFKGSGGYSEGDKKEYKAFMQQIMNGQFPEGQYVVKGFADFYVIDIDGTEKKYKINAQIDFSVSNSSGK